MFDLIVDTSRTGARMGIFGEKFSEEIFEANARGESLLNVLENLLKKADVSLENVSRVLVLRGPGSFTGLRTGIAFCEGLCFTGKRELFGVSTLAALTLYGSKESTAVILRARSGYWYFRDFANESSFFETEEHFWNTEKVQQCLANTRAKNVVVDSFAIAEIAFQPFFSEGKLKTILESEQGLLPFRTAFEWESPSLVQEANYIQPSYAEQ